MRPMLDVAYFISGLEGRAVARVYFLPVSRGGATPFIIGFCCAEQFHPHLGIF